MNRRNNVWWISASAFLVSGLIFFSFSSNASAQPVYLSCIAAGNLSSAAPSFINDVCQTSAGKLRAVVVEESELSGLAEKHPNSRIINVHLSIRDRHHVAVEVEAGAGANWGRKQPAISDEFSIDVMDSSIDIAVPTHLSTYLERLLKDKSLFE